MYMYIHVYISIYVSLNMYTSECKYEYTWLYSCMFVHVNTYEGMCVLISVRKRRLHEKIMCTMYTCKYISKKYTPGDVISVIICATIECVPLSWCCLILTRCLADMETYLNENRYSRDLHVEKMVQGKRRYRLPLFEYGTHLIAEHEYLASNANGLPRFLRDLLYECYNPWETWPHVFQPLQDYQGRLPRVRLVGVCDYCLMTMWEVGVCFGTTTHTPTHEIT